MSGAPCVSHPDGVPTNIDEGQFSYVGEWNNRPLFANGNAYSYYDLTYRPEYHVSTIGDSHGNTWWMRIQAPAAFIDLHKRVWTWNRCTEVAGGRLILTQDVTACKTCGSGK